MRSKLLLGAAVALAIGLAPAAHASITPPGNQWEPIGAGCGFVAVNTNPTNPPNTHFEGPTVCTVVWTPVNPTTPPTTAVTAASVTTWLQNCPDYNACPAVQGSTCPIGGPLPGTAVGTCVISYNNPSSQALYYCTEYTWTETNPTTGQSKTYTLQVDDDPVTPGKQCSPVGFF